MKPTKGKCYGSIGHLPGSKAGTGDHFMSGGQVKILTEKARDKHDEIIVQEKLDGSCVGVLMQEGKIVPIIRAGYKAEDARREQHKYFNQWAFGNYWLFDWLPEGWRVVGEWLLQVHSIAYDITHLSPFVAFDIFNEKNERICYSEFSMLCDTYGLTTAPLLHRGGPCSIEKAEQELGVYGHYLARLPAEGAVWRVERKGKVGFLGKYVRKDFDTGSRLKDEIYNVDPEKIMPKTHDLSLC